MLTRSQLNSARKKLETLLQRLDRERAGLSEEAFGASAEAGGGWDLPRRPDEQGGVRLEDEITIGLMEHGDGLVAQIGAALQRIDAGTYGRCDGCGRPIALRRLQALPYATRCIACARTALPVGGA